MDAPKTKIKNFEIHTPAVSQLHPDGILQFTKTATVQTSPDKTVIFPATTASFTVPLEPEVSLCCANLPKGLSLL